MARLGAAPDGKVASRAGLLRRPTFRHREMGHHHPRSGSLSIARAFR